MRSRAVLAAFTGLSIAVGAFGEAGAIAVRADAQNVRSDVASDEIVIDMTTFPDDCFRDYVSSNFDLDHSGSLDKDEINAVTQIDVEQEEIYEMTGIEYFTNLQELNCAWCRLDDLELGANTKLNALYVAGTSITFLDLQKTPDLLRLDCDFTNIPSLDVSVCSHLEYLSCCSIGLETLDVSKNTELEFLHCDDNALTSIDLSKNEKLTRLSVSQNSLTSLDLSHNTCLKNLTCFENALSELDLSNNPDLESLECISNEITNLIVKNHTSLYYLRCEGNKLDKLSIAGCTKLLELTEMVERQKVDPSASFKDGYYFYWQRFYVDPDKNYEDWHLSYDLNMELILEEKQVTPDPDPDTPTPEPGQDSPTPEPQPDTPTPEPQPDTPTPEPANPEPQPETPTPEPVKDPSFEDFVERLYTVALGRASEAEGKAFWVEQVVKNGFTGADCARFFMLGAPEFLGRNLTDDEFVEVLYKTYFDRDSEPDGKAYWMGRLADGTARAVLVEEFIESVEWCNVCATYGVKSGALYHKATVPSKNAVKFATRLYTCCLGRDPEEEGLNYWSLALTNLDATGYQAASLFFTLPEFAGLKTSNEEYLTRLYTTFMGREPEADGFNYWLGLLNGGTAREDVMKAFASCPEFQEICNQYGIERGEI